MTDGIIKGTGNSRYLKSVANVMSLYPEYTDFLRALAEGTFPVDLYGINAGGWQVRGNDINKASLLKDATASLYGKGTTATVDDILAAIRPLITTAQSTASSRLDDTWGSWTGTGESTKTLLIGGGFIPRLIVIIGTQGAFMLLTYGVNNVATNESSRDVASVTWDGWSGSRFSVTLKSVGNVSGRTYDYYAIG